MKKFTKIISQCQECPNVTYLHFDGEGECAPYQYNFPQCKLEPEYKFIDNRGNLFNPPVRIGYKMIPQPSNRIPSWCQLPNA